MDTGYIQLTLLIFAVAIGAACIWGLIVPRQLTNFVRTYWQRKSSMPVAVVARVVLGLLLIGAASDARYPLVFQVLGWLAIIAAMLLPILGKQRVGQLIAWLDERPEALMRLWLLFGLGFAEFLIHGLGLV